MVGVSQKPKKRESTGRNGSSNAAPEALFDFSIMQPIDFYVLKKDAIGL